MYNLSMKLAITWLVIGFLIYLAGAWEIHLSPWAKDKGIRWYAITVWILLGAVTGLYRLWV